MQGAVEEAGVERKFLVGKATSVDPELELPVKVHWHAPADPTQVESSVWRPVLTATRKPRPRIDAVALESVWLSFGMEDNKLPADVIEFLRDQKLL